MKHLSYGTAVLLLAACGHVAISGAGTTNRGESVVGELLADPYNSGNHLFIRSPHGWICRSIYLEDNRPPALQPLKRDVPLMCSNGARGIAEVSARGNGHRVGVEFLLDDGTSGKVTVGER